jgi:hypothetical protein
MREACLEKPDHRRVVEELRIHPSAPAPRRHDQHWHPDAQTVRTRRVIGIAGEDLIGDLDGRQPFGA